MKKLKFFMLTCLLLFARGCDFYSTSLFFFQPDGMKGETNPLTRIFGVGWTGLIIANVIVVGIIIYAYYYFTFKYQPRRLESKADRFTDFVSEVYFHEKGHFARVFFRFPDDKKILLAHMGYVMVRVLIIASFLATFHNLCQFYGVPFYNTFRDAVQRPLYFIYCMIVISFFFFLFRIWMKEYRLLQNQFSNMEPLKTD